MSRTRTAAGQHRRGKVSAEHGLPDRVLPGPTLSMVKVSEVGWASASGRTGTENDLAIGELAASLGASGQIDPIIVIALPAPIDGCEYEGVDGYRRCLASGRFGPEGKDSIDRLQALVYPSSCAGRAEEIRAAAIVQSLPHSDVEKALMVGALVDEQLEKHGDNMSVAIEAVAAMLNKPERFVSDYRYLTRLSKVSRSLLVDRRLTLSQARDLATVSDHDVQDEIAREAASNVGGGFGRDVEWVRRRCKEVRRNLKIIAWDAMVNFAGKPACISCPSNTANDGNLYAHDPVESKHLKDLAEERSGLGLCVNPKCFQHKADAAEQAREGLAKKAAAEAKKIEKAGHFDDASQVARTVIERERAKGGLAAGLKESIAMRTAKEAAETVVPGAGNQGQAGQTPAPPEAGAKANRLDTVRTVEQKAQERFDAAMGHWQSEVRTAVFDELAKRPGGQVLFAQMITVGELDGLASSYKGDDVEKKMAVKIQSPSSLKAVEPLTMLVKLTDLDLANTSAGAVLKMLADREAHDRLAYWYDEAQAATDDLADCVVLFILKAIDAEAGAAWATKQPKIETFLAEAGVARGTTEPTEPDAGNATKGKSKPKVRAAEMAGAGGEA